MDPPPPPPNLTDIVTSLVDEVGWPALALALPGVGFEHLSRDPAAAPAPADPSRAPGADAATSTVLLSVASVVAFLERDAQARGRVERYHQLHQRRQLPQAPRAHASDVRALAGLIVEATRGVVGVVKDVHGAIGAVPVVSDVVYAGVRGVTGVVGFGIDAVVGALAPLLGGSVPGDEREAVLAALNGVVGDHLARTHNPLAISMSLRPPLGLLPPGGTLLVLVHGSSMNDRQWRRSGHETGAALAHDLGVTPVWLHYNSGLHISDNGRSLARLLEEHSAPFADIVVVGHSMGGLLARAAAAVAEQQGLGWRSRLRALVTLGSPHHGAPLERGGNVLELLLGSTRYSAPLSALGQIRSAGVTDLRFGNVADADWQDRDRFAAGPDPRTPTPLPAGVRCFAVAGSLTPRSEAVSGDAVGDVGPSGEPGRAHRDREIGLLGDGLVPVASALGRHPDPRFALTFDGTLVVRGTNHLGLLAHPEVYAQLRSWLTRR